MMSVAHLLNFRFPPDAISLASIDDLEGALAYWLAAFAVKEATAAQAVDGLLVAVKNDKNLRVKVGGQNRRCGG